MVDRVAPGFDPPPFLRKPEKDSWDEARFMVEGIRARRDKILSLGLHTNVNFDANLARWEGELVRREGPTDITAGEQ